MTGPLTPSSIFTVGPFAETSERLTSFGSNLYFAHLLTDSIKKHTEIQKEYDEAVQKDDHVTSSQRQMELDLMDGVYKVSLSVFQSDEELIS
tara:strand:+ start:1499 stop:1774 length:276 start_codon:yes stop_codon:yes gene_type:complete